ncbi:hypothetical protein ACIRD3_18750 [Kitasatospora sp. NPDC093550]|uniref:hypothetical protein n=1 Tax=Kitasatospora sp. NPDC093550 TaxID=3364089 RepID=UPI0038114D98
MRRNGRPSRLDGDAAYLVAVGLVRLGAQEWLGTAGGAPAWVGGLRAASFADAWLAFGDPAAPGLRVPATAALRAVAERAAQLVVRACADDESAALEWLGQRSAEAREEARRDEVSHPAEPCALTLVWHAVQALAAGAEPSGDGRTDGCVDDGPDGGVDDGPDAHVAADAHADGLGEDRITERVEAYVRERHRRQDTLALVLGCTRIAAAALVELCDNDPARVCRWLEQDAARVMQRGGPAPLWVPGRPWQPAG